MQNSQDLSIFTRFRILRVSSFLIIFKAIRILIELFKNIRKKNSNDHLDDILYVLKSSRSLSHRSLL